MSFSSMYYTRYLHNAQVTFDNLQKSPAIKEQIAEYGYDDNRITEVPTGLSCFSSPPLRHPYIRNLKNRSNPFPTVPHPCLSPFSFVFI
jgi:hypothetical protein